MAIQLTFDDLRPETLKALASDPGVPEDLRTEIEGLLFDQSDELVIGKPVSGPRAERLRKTKPIAASFGGELSATSFIDFCKESVTANS